MTRLQEFEVWIREGHGRCHECGWHPATQGHNPDCTKIKKERKT